MDFYGRKIPKPVHGTANQEMPTSSAEVIKKSALDIYDRIADKNLSVRKINITANQIIEETGICQAPFEQMAMFDDYLQDEKEAAVRRKRIEREKSVQKTTLKLQRRFGRGAILHGYNLLEGAMTVERNGQIGGHKA